MENNKQPLTAEILKEKLIAHFNDWGNFNTIQDVITGFKQQPEQSIELLTGFLNNELDEQTKPLKEEIERLRDVSTQHLLDYTESNVLLQEKVAELESSLSLAKKENEELKTLNEKTEREWEGQRKRVKEYKDKMEAELTSVKEQLQTAEKELGNLKVRNANIVGDSTWTDIKINELKEQNKELAEALDEVVIYLGDEKDFERAERFLIKKIKPALTNYKQTKT